MSRRDPPVIQLLRDFPQLLEEHRHEDIRGDAHVPAVRQHAAAGVVIFRKF